MKKGLYIIGTDTDVGKTFISAGIMHLLLKNNFDACYFKPVSSGGFFNEKEFVSYDVDFIKKFTGFTELYDQINPYRFKNAVSPHLAAQIEGEEISIEKIYNYYLNLKDNNTFVLIEGCGGLMVPFSNNGVMQHHLISKINLKCILISRTSLGTINHTLMTLNIAKSLGIDIAGIIFNEFDDTLIAKNNIKTIENLTGISVISVVPTLDKSLLSNGKFDDAKNIFQSLNFLDKLLEVI